MKQCLRRSWKTADIVDQGLQVIPYAEEPLKFSVIFMLIRPALAEGKVNRLIYLLGCSEKDLI